MSKKKNRTLLLLSNYFILQRQLNHNIILIYHRNHTPSALLLCVSKSKHILVDRSGTYLPPLLGMTNQYCLREPNSNSLQRDPKHFILVSFFREKRYLELTWSHSCSVHLGTNSQTWTMSRPLTLRQRRKYRYHNSSTGLIQLPELLLGRRSCMCGSQRLVGPRAGLQDKVRWGGRLLHLKWG